MNAADPTAQVHDVPGPAPADDVSSRIGERWASASFFAAFFAPILSLIAGKIEPYIGASVLCLGGLIAVAAAIRAFFLRVGTIGKIMALAGLVLGLSELLLGLALLARFWPRTVV